MLYCKRGKCKWVNGGKCKWVKLCGFHSFILNGKGFPAKVCQATHRHQKNLFTVQYKILEREIFGKTVHTRNTKFWKEKFLAKQFTQEIAK